MVTPSIRLIEEITFNAWPSPQTLLYDGWSIRFAGGYTRRANSVYPLYSSTENLEQKIAHCETLYGQRGLPTVFKMTAASQPDGLDDALAARGYTSEGETALRLLELSAWVGNADPNVEINETLSRDWFDAFWTISQSAGKNQTAAWNIFGNIALPTAYLFLKHEGKVVTCALAVLQNGFVGLYDMVTAPDARQKGYAHRVVQTLLVWAKAKGARTAYLQVMNNNAPARALYSGLGYQEVYQYWYRVKPKS
jgi:N-acetylglutamate synthase